jgi:hypothetical protein
MSNRMSICTLLSIISLMIVGAIKDTVQEDRKSQHVVSRKLRFDPKTVDEKDTSRTTNSFKPKIDWCIESHLEPLPYDSCNADDIVYRIPLHGGMTNAIKMILLGVIKAFEENRCFFLDETSSHLNNFDKVNFYQNGFYARYFERIGLYNEDARVQKARQENRIRSLTWKEVWEPIYYRRVPDQLTSIPSLGYHQVPGHELKAIMLQRMWRPLPAIRQATCERMHKLLGTTQGTPFLAMSIRRGDKYLENFDYTTMDTYLHAAERILQDYFHHVEVDVIVPTIFVASDDCTVLSELRSAKPTWKFVSECDNSQQTGFVINDMYEWDIAEHDKHNAKFFTELFTMAAAAYWIGVAYTNVSWFVYFMRGGVMENFELLDAPAGTNVILSSW